MNSENSKTDTLNLPDLTNKLNLKDPKNMALANLSIYYTWENIKPATTATIQQQYNNTTTIQQYSNNKFKISVPTWNDTFTTINLKFQHQLGLIILIYRTDPIWFLTSKITLNLSSRNTKLLLKILTYKFTQIKLKTELFSK